ncbi:MAG: hypothetical protein MI862_12570 [Desulfobacterales bacterium]|nr:hypothetical protein [Desulfobacterales bacterium]
MASVQCNIFQGTNQEFKELDTNSNLSEVRTQLGSFMKSTYLFVYYDERQQKQLMQPKNTESNYKLSSILGEQNNLTITDPNANKPDLEGILVSWFTDRNLQVGVRLNNANPDAVAANKDKFQPFMLEKVQTIKDAAEDFPNVYWNYAVICEKGSAISFNYSCWGAAGYGFSIKSDRSTIISGLYVVNNGNYATTTFSGLSRYQDTKQNIVVDSLSDQGIPIGDRLQYSSVTFKAWNVKGYKQNGQSYSSNAQPPYRRSTDPGGMAKKNGVIVPGGGIESGSPHAKGTSHQDWGAPLSSLDQDTNCVLGEMDIYFLVFKNHEAATQMVRQNNLPMI